MPSSHVIRERYLALVDAMEEAGVPIGEIGGSKDAAIAMEVIAKASGRVCGECTLCCATFENASLGKPPMEMCRHACSGCDIYEDRPDECRLFMCFWLMGILDHRDRPDRSHIVVDWCQNNMSVAHEVLGPTWHAPSVIRVSSLDMSYAIRARKVINSLSEVSAVIVHAGSPVEARLVVNGMWHPIQVIKHDDGAYSYVSEFLMKSAQLVLQDHHAG